MSFIIIAGFMILLVVCLLAYSVLFYTARKKTSYEHRIQRNVRLYQNRVKELRKDLDTELINSETHDRLFVESTRALLNTVQHQEKNAQQAPLRKKWLWLVLPMPLLAIVIYSLLGALPDWRISQQLQALKAAKTVDSYQTLVKQVRLRIEERLIDRPDNLDYHILAARFAMDSADYQAAVTHFVILSELLPNDADALAYLAQAQYLQNKKQITPDINTLIDKALVINPKQVMALTLAGLADFEQQDYDKAMAHWQFLLDLLPSDSDRRPMLEAGIRQATAKLSGTVKLPQVVEAQKENLNQGISLKVALSPDISGIAINTPVFVYVKAGSGPPMPLAVKKITVADLPAEIYLDDSQAMMPQMKLSLFQDVIAGARVSLQGDPMPKPGDWQVESGVINWRKASTLSLEIKEKL